MTVITKQLLLLSSVKNSYLQTTSLQYYGYLREKLW